MNEDQRKLDREILTILDHAQGQALTIPQIEEKLAGKVAADTFDVRERWARVITDIDDIDALLTFYDAYAHEYSHFNLPKITSAKHLSSSKVQAWLRNRLEKAKKQGAIEERSGGKIKCHAWNVKARDLEEGQLAEWEQW